ncbi:secretion system X translation initiation factor [Pseudomonas sp. UL073]|uniref:Secretion system X translation initiation factor n=1 Tax=Zestomonas insulae TaxID=2809017 RepID=A0ABS2I7S2_9GAMM|nr:secretion system X translation initiation factor [Pseudomonas insulae]MBM7059194.1 secretion system X translation initiation factor [Pseudomonas insulae]
MDSRRRWYWLAFLGGAALIAAVPELYFTAEPADDVAMPAKRGADTSGQLAALRGAPAATPVSAAIPAAARTAHVPQADLFAAHSWYVAPPAPPRSNLAPVAPPPPPAPMAPPLPFQFIGKLDDSLRQQVFLLSGERLHIVGVGDVIDGTYRVEQISDSQLTLTYLPLHMTQALVVGSRL